MVSAYLLELTHFQKPYINLLTWSSNQILILKFRYSEKATKFGSSSTLYLTLCKITSGRRAKFLWASQNIWTLRIWNNKSGAPLYVRPVRPAHTQFGPETALTRHSLRPGNTSARNNFDPENTSARLYTLARKQLWPREYFSPAQLETLLFLYPHCVGPT